MVYNFLNLKSVFSQIAGLKNNPEIYSRFKEQFNNEFIFNSGFFKSYCVINNVPFIGKVTLEPIIENFNDTFKTDVTVKDFKKHAVNSKTPLTFIPVTDFSSFQSEIFVLENNRSDERNAKKQARKSRYYQPLNLDLSGKKILTIDFEYRSSKKLTEIIEMGITIAVDDQVENYHYSAFTSRLTGFKYGDSIHLVGADFHSFLIDHLKDVDYIVGHSVDMEFNVLEKTGFDMSLVNHIPVIDTCNVLKTEFKFNDRKKSEGNISLKDALRKFEVPFTNSQLHNAGNDAAFTYELLKKIVNYKLNNLLIGGTFPIKI